MQNNQTGVTIVEVLIALAISAAVFLMFLRAFTDYTRRASLEQGTQVFSADINDVLNDIRVGDAPVVDGVECYINPAFTDYDKIIHFRNNNTKLGDHTGKGNQCQFIGKAIQLGSNYTGNTSNVGGCVVSGTICEDNPTKHAEDYAIHAVIGTDDANSARVNFADLGQLLVLNHQQGSNLYGRAYNLERDYPELYKRKVYENHSNSNLKNHYWDWAGDGSEDIASSFNTSEFKYLPQGLVIKASYIWDDANGNSFVDTGETVTYIDGFIVINADFGIESSESEDGFLGGSRNIQILALYQPSSDANKADRLRPSGPGPQGGVYNSNEFIRRLEGNHVSPSVTPALNTYYQKINSPIIVCLALGTDRMSIVQIGSRSGVISAEPDFDGLHIDNKCGDLPTA